MKPNRIAAKGLAVFMIAALASCGGSGGDAVPAPIRAVFNDPFYKGGNWTLRVVDLDTGKVLLAEDKGDPILIGSVRKLFSVGLAMDALGSEHRIQTPVYAAGPLDPQGHLAGDLVLVAKGDLAMGGRTLPDGSLAITDLDHNEAIALGQAELPDTDPLAGFKDLARQVRERGMTRVEGDVIVDDRLFDAFDFRGEFPLGPMFVNDDLVDVIMRPGAASGNPAQVEWRPHSAQFLLRNQAFTAPAGSDNTIALIPEEGIDCLGSEGCVGEVRGGLPLGFKPEIGPPTPWVQTLRIKDPSTYARGVFIEALNAEGIQTPGASVVARNPVGRLPSPEAVQSNPRVAQLQSHPFKDHARLILKVSYNIGAELSLMLLGLTQGAHTQLDALAAERDILQRQYGIAPSDHTFVDGSGGGETRATAASVIRLLTAIRTRPSGGDFRTALPIMGVDGSLSSVNAFEKQPDLAGAKGQVRAKTGTFITLDDDQTLRLHTQAMAGYIDSRTGRHLGYVLAIQGIALPGGIPDLLRVMQDQGVISAQLWRLD